MRLFPPQLQIGDTEGFTKEKDIFDRAGIGKGLTNIISNVTDPLVIAVDGQWGSGKTTFLKMWAGELRKSGFPVVYFDAFANDYAEDAFTAIASEIVLLAQEKRQATTPAAQQFVKRAIGASKVLLRSGLKVGVKLGTFGALEAADLGSVAGDLSKELSELGDRYLGEILTKQKEQKEIIQSFRGALIELPALLTGPAEGADSAASVASKPLIIIVDELDRCRPLFALQILERIKHFFAVSGVHFVLGTHLGQLRNSVTVAYGPNIEAQTYLQKFIHLTLHLVERSLHRHQRVTYKYIEYLAAAMQFRSEDGEAVSLAKDYFNHVGEHKNLSLRAIEQIYSTLAIALACRPKNRFAPDAIIVGLAVLKIIEPDLYVKAKDGTLTWDEVHVALGFNFDAHEQDRQRVAHMSAIWQYATNKQLSPDDALHQEFGDVLSRFHLERMQQVPVVANLVMDRFTVDLGAF